MTQLNFNQRMGIEIKEEFRFVYSFYNRASLISGPIKIGSCPIIKGDQEKPLKKCCLKKEESDFIH